MDMIPQDAPLKQCTACLKFFPATLDYFHAHKSTRDRLRKECKACRSKQRKAYHAQPEIKARENALARVWDEDNREHRQAYREHRRPIRREYDKQYSQEHKDELQAYRDTHKQETRTQHLHWYEKNRPRLLERYHQYAQDNKDVRRSIDHNRRARKQKAEGTYNSNNIHLQHIKQNGLCYYCQCELTIYHIDHMIPLSRGGTNWPDNLVLSCPHCNLTKHNKLLSEWVEGGRLF